MLKLLDSVKDTEDQAVQALRGVLAQVPGLALMRPDHKVLDPGRRANVVLRLKMGNQSYKLVCHVEADGQPRNVRMRAMWLKQHIAVDQDKVTPVIIAPYLSPQAQAICREEKIGFLDLEGNCRLAFGGVFIDRQVATKPPAERRAFRSIFKPKSARVLRVMLESPPQRVWRVTALANLAHVSLGHVSNVRTALLEREWATASPQGLALAQPAALLDAWRQVYEPPAGERLGFYTPLHGAAYDEAMYRALLVANAHGQAMLASFSAARWLAPYARVATHYYYADKPGLGALRETLELSSSAKGENVVITVPRDPELFREKCEHPKVYHTGLVRTYLDLSLAGERGREAADHLWQSDAWPR